MKKHIKTILSFTLVIALVCGIVISSISINHTEEPLPNGYSRVGQFAKYAVSTYRDAIGTYDLVMTGKTAWYTTDNVFLDPHEAWESYITNKKPNNWFGKWIRTHYAVVDDLFESNQMPNNIYPDSPSWWARMDSYLELVAPKEHVIDNDLTVDEFLKSSMDYIYKYSDMDNLWIEWYDMTVDKAKAPEYAPYQGMPFEEWVEMRTTMSDEEDALFDEWYHSRIDHDPNDGGTFEGYKEHKGFSENQPVQPSTVPEPTVTPTATPVPTATPEPTPVPTETPAPVETQPVQHFADVSPDAWYYEAVNNMAEAGILKGKGDGLFHPMDSITYAEVATIICRISQTASKEYTAIGNPDSRHYDERIVNNPAHWAERAMRATSSSSTNNDQTATFSASVQTADNNCKRLEVFSAMSRLALEDQFPQYWHYEFPWKDHPNWAFKYLNVTDEDKAKAESEIHDIKTLEGHYIPMADDIINCWALGIIHGDGNGYVHPYDPITRAELCQILYNMGAKTCYLDL